MLSKQPENSIAYALQSSTIFLYNKINGSTVKAENQSAKYSLIELEEEAIVKMVFEYDQQK